ncbi:MAG: hypothetical protein RIE74_05015 [Pseudomonadales bacterium]
MAIHRLPELDEIRSSEFKTPGWRSVLERLTRSTYGALAITSHQRPQGVLLTTESYERLIQLASQSVTREEDVLKSLRMEFDERLASLAEPNAADRMRRAAKEPLAIGGKFRVGESH